ncbi:MAG: Panacea domain-containing protein [Candidatus Binataceae bacterium]
MLLVKLLYYADREAILRRGAPITGDEMTSMDFGPVLSCVLDYVRGTKPRGPIWQQYVSESEFYTVKLLNPEPDLGALSEFERQVLKEQDERYGSQDPFEVSAASHKLPEWRDPLGSSLPIQVDEVLRVGGASDKDITDVAANARIEWFFRRLEET